MIAIINIGIYISIIIVAVIYIIVVRENYEPDISFLTMLTIFFVSEIISFILFNLSTEMWFDQETSLKLWYGALISGSISIGIWASVHAIELNKRSKVRYLPVLISISVFGILISFFVNPNLFIVVESNSNYLYLSQNNIFLIWFLIYNGLIITISSITQITGFQNYSDRDLGVLFNYFGITFIFRIINHSIFLLFDTLFLKNLVIVAYFLNLIIILIIIIKKPNFFVVFTNKIYDFIIFHKSGILLYSYNFQTNKEFDDSLLKGSILIGINHILNNFSNVKNQLDLIKLQDKEVIFQFNNELGFATLLVAKHKNTILERSVNKFNNEFSKKFEANLVNLNGLVDISNFSDTKTIIDQFFKRYILIK